MRKLTHDQKFALIAVAVLAVFIVKVRPWTSSTPAPRPEPPVQEEPQPPQAPSFEDYPAAESLDGAPAAVQLRQDEPAWQFRTQLRAAAAEGPDFAGAYAVASWGCGTSCQQNAVIDARTGAIVAFNLMTTAGVEHRLDSRLLIAMQPSATIEGLDAGLAIPSYYVMDGGNLKLVGRLIDGAYVPFSE